MSPMKNGPTELIVFKAAVSDGQKKPGVDEGPAMLLAYAKQNSSVFASATVVRTVDFAEQMAAEHADHLSAASNSASNRSQHGLRSVEKADNESFARLHRPLSVGSANRAIHNAIVQTYTPDSFVLTLGGDHSIAIGTISALSLLYKQHLKQDILVFWIDAHADFHSPSTTPSGNIHGCPVGFLMQLPGTGIPGFEWLGGRRYITDIAYYGLRDVEQEEVDHIAEYKAHAMWAADIEKRRGEPNYMQRMIGEALDKLDPDGVRPIHCSFDIDSLDPRHAPSTGTPVSQGLGLDEGLAIVRALRQTGRLRSMDLVEVNPKLGSEQDIKTTFDSALQVISAALR